MGAPTWPPDPRRACALTAAEYGVDPASIGADVDPGVAERSILSAFLFGSPGRQVLAGDCGLTLAEVRRPLHALLRMVTGLDLGLEISDPAATDGRSVFLPAAAPAPRDPDDALLLRCTGLVQAGLVRHGLLGPRASLADLHRDRVLRSTFHLLAVRYVVAAWSRDFPGFRADFEALRHLPKAAVLRVHLTVVPAAGMPRAFLPLYDGLAAIPGRAGPAGADAARAVAAVDAVRDDDDARAVILGQAARLREAFRAARLGPPPLPWFAGDLRPGWILEDLARDPEAEEAWRRGPDPLAALARAHRGDGGDMGLRERLKAEIGRFLQGPGGPGDLGPAHGALRDEHRARQAPPPSRPRWTPGTPPGALLEDASPAAPRPEDGVRLDEWDDAAGTWRVGAVRVVERPAPLGPPDAWDRIAAAHGGRVAEVRRRFEALRVEERWLHGQPDGPEVDLDRAILAACDVRAGCQPDPRVHMAFRRERQAVAILVLVDLSGSTQGRVIHLEQDALVLLAEGLSALGFPHAVHGFHGDGPDACRSERIKGFDEPWDDAARRRCATLHPGGATRLGAFVRHGAGLLAARPEGRRVLLVLSDGRPEDRDAYRGEQGIHDSALAVLEARRAGVRVHCVSLDPAEDAAAYLGRIFGTGRYLLLPRVEDLPARLPEVLRALVR